MFVACGIWCVADVSSVTPSSKQTEVWSVADVSRVSPSSVALPRTSLLRLRANARKVSYTPYPTGEKHTISTLLIKPVY